MRFDTETKQNIRSSPLSHDFIWFVGVVLIYRGKENHEKTFFVQEFFKDHLL